MFVLCLGQMYPPRLLQPPDVVVFPGIKSFFEIPDCKGTSGSGAQISGLELL